MGESKGFAELDYLVPYDEIGRIKIEETRTGIGRPVPPGAILFELNYEKDGAEVIFYGFSGTPRFNLEKGGYDG